MSHVALAWLKGKGAMPIVSINSVERIEEMCGLHGKALAEEEMAHLEEAYVTRPVVGHK
jgi:diketogulonate reductase-like aldo/keto reductase